MREGGTVGVGAGAGGTGREGYRRDCVYTREGDWRGGEEGEEREEEVYVRAMTRGCMLFGENERGR